MREPIIKIGVTYTGTDEKHSNYVQWLKGNDQVDIIALTPGRTKLEGVPQLDGIVLSGGIDMHPKYYHSDQLHYPNAPKHFHEDRDAFEIAVFGIAQANQIPLLGVCRGMQLVNCVLGGTMVQDVGTVANSIHRYEHDDKAHGINIINGSLLHQLTGQLRSVVNSAHHQSIDDLGNGLSVSCTSDDGIIEGIEWTDKETKPFFIGIQWHPERMYKLNLATSPVTKNIRDHFINAIHAKRD